MKKRKDGEEKPGWWIQYGTQLAGCPWGYGAGVTGGQGRGSEVTHSFRDLEPMRALFLYSIMILRMSEYVEVWFMGPNLATPTITVKADNASPFLSVGPPGVVPVGLSPPSRLVLQCAKRK